MYYRDIWSFPKSQIRVGQYFTQVFRGFRAMPLGLHTYRTHV